MNDKNNEMVRTADPTTGPDGHDQTWITLERKHMPTSDVASAFQASAFRFDIEGLVCIGVVVAIAVLATSFRKTARRCPRCSEVNREAAVFCAQCGKRLTDP